MKLYKIIKDGESCHGEKYKWSLPKNNEPGDWAHKGGYHLYHPESLWGYILADADVYEVEHEGKCRKDGFQVVVERCRLVKLVGKFSPAILVECAIVHAESVLPIFEPNRPSDKRPRQAIEAAKYNANDADLASDAAALAADAVGTTGLAATASAYAAAYVSRAVVKGLSANAIVDAAAYAVMSAARATGKPVAAKREYALKLIQQLQEKQ